MEESADYWRSIYKKNENIVTRKIAGEVILVPIRGNLADMQRVFTLNPVAEYIWDRLDGKQPLDGIRSGVLENFAVESDEAERDIREFLDRLIEFELAADAQVMK